jgi:hypothetical protein
LPFLRVGQFCICYFFFFGVSFALSTAHPKWKWRERHELFAAAEIIFRSRWPGVEGDRSTICRPTLFESLVESTNEHDGFPDAGSVTERWHSCAWLAFASILRLHVIGNTFWDRLAESAAPPYRGRRCNACLLLVQPVARRRD